MGNTDPLLDTPKDNDFMAPIELQRIACIKFQRDIAPADSRASAFEAHYASAHRVI